MGLEKILKYKARHRDSAAWNQLINFLSQLPVENLKECLELLRVQNKTNEDKVDAIVCAYIAYYWWRYGTDRSSIIGSLTSGYIVTPHTDGMLSRFRSVFGDQVNNPTMVSTETASQN
jgi:predicted RNase H-like nuclease